VRKHVDQMLDAVLRAYRAGDGGENRGEDHRVRERPQPDIAKNESKRTIRVTTKVGHPSAAPRGQVFPPAAIAQHPNAENGKSIRPHHDFMTFATERILLAVAYLR